MGGAARRQNSRYAATLLPPGAGGTVPTCPLAGNARAVSDASATPMARTPVGSSSWYQESPPEPERASALASIRLGSMKFAHQGGCRRASAKGAAILIGALEATVRALPGRTPAGIRGSCQLVVIGLF